MFPPLLRIKLRASGSFEIDTTSGEIDVKATEITAHKKSPPVERPSPPENRAVRLTVPINLTDELRLQLGIPYPF